MAWFRRRRRHKPRFSPFDKSALPPVVPPDLRRALEEGVTMAEYTARMTLKNAIIVEALRGADYDEDRFVGEARALYRELAEESLRAADEIEAAQRKAAKRTGIARHPHDYRPADKRNLRLREEVSRELAVRLTARAEDPDGLRPLVERAREDAWRDLSGALDDSLDAYAGVEAWRDDYEQERPARLQEFLSHDLARLMEERGGY